MTVGAPWPFRGLVLTGFEGAIRRITLPEAFLAADAVLMTLDNVANVSISCLYENI